MKAIYTGYLQPATEQTFQLAQLDRYEGFITSTGGDVKVFIKCKATTNEAALKYSFPSNMNEGVLFEIPFNTDQTQTADDLCNAINAEVSNPSSPLVGLISAGAIGLFPGDLGIESNTQGLSIEVTCISGLVLNQTNEPYDAATDYRDVKLKGVVRTGSISYLENGDSVNYLNGLKVAQDQTFIIEGRDNLLRAKVIQISLGAELNYTVYVK